MEIEDLGSNKKGEKKWNRFFYKIQKEYLLSPLLTDQTSRNALFEKKEWLHILEKGLLAWIAMLHRKTSEKNGRPFPPSVYYHFHFSLCQTKNWIKALFFTERDFLSSRSNLLYKVTREEEHIRPPPCVPSQISLVSVSLCKHRGLGGGEKKVH